MRFLLTSTAFEEGQPIPDQYTGYGADLSPPLKWFDPPRGAHSFALVCEDLDAPGGVFTHWLIFNIPSVERELSEGVPRTEGLPNGIRQGTNAFGNIGYNGPKPPSGTPHRFVFRLFALGRKLDLEAAVGMEQLLQAMQGHILEETRLTGTYAPGQWKDLPRDPVAKKAAQDRASIPTAPLG